MNLNEPVTEFETSVNTFIYLHIVLLNIRKRTRVKIHFCDTPGAISRYFGLPVLVYTDLKYLRDNFGTVRVGPHRNMHKRLARLDVLIRLFELRTVYYTTVSTKLAS
jgi:hypothetical protein